MAVELDIKLNAPLLASELVAGVVSALQDWFPQVEHFKASEGAARLLEPGLSLELAIGNEALVTALVHTIGSEHDFGEEGGAWVTFSAGELRTPASIFLAALSATVAARLTKGALVDESGLLGGSGKLDVASVWQHLEQASRGRGTLESAAKRLFGHFFE